MKMPDSWYSYIIMCRRDEPIEIIDTEHEKYDNTHVGYVFNEHTGSGYYSDGHDIWKLQQRGLKRIQSFSACLGKTKMEITMAEKLRVQNLKRKRPQTFTLIGVKDMLSTEIALSKPDSSNPLYNQFFFENLGIELGYMCNLIYYGYIPEDEKHFVYVFKNAVIREITHRWHPGDPKGIERIIKGTFEECVSIIPNEDGE